MIARYSNDVDTTPGIWDFLYLIRVPYLATMSVEYIREFGIPTSGNKDIDLEQARQLITTYATINTMVNYFKEDVPVRIVNFSDVEKIYLAISAHLNAWHSQLVHGVNIGGAPLEDLLLLDRFANSIYGAVKYDLPNGGENSSFVKALSGFGIFEPKSAFGKMARNKSRNDIRRAGYEDIPLEDEIPERESMGDLLKQSLARSNMFKGK